MAFEAERNPAERKNGGKRSSALSADVGHKAVAKKPKDFLGRQAGSLEAVEVKSHIHFEDIPDKPIRSTASQYHSVF